MAARPWRILPLIVRDAKKADLTRIVEIYNASIASRKSTGDLEPITVESRQEWFDRHTPDHRPLWVVEIDGEVAAWAGLSSFYTGRAAYEATAEFSIYVDPRHQRHGLGRILMRKMIDECPRLGVETLIGMIFDHNAASLGLCAKLGFEEMGHMPEVAELDGIRRGLIIAGRRIRP
jgi:L-amino acid N-acyltransferase YncA